MGTGETSEGGWVNMEQAVYDATSVWLHPLRFLGAVARDLRNCPGIALRLFISRLKAQHRRSWLGYLWLILPSLATTLTCVILRSQHVIAFPATSAPYPVFVLTGTVLWQAFVEALNAPLQQLGAGRAMISRSRIPHEAFILAGAMLVCLNTAIRLLLLVVTLVLFGVPLSASMALAPLGLAGLIVMGMALGLLVAPFGLLYDDVGRALTVVTGFWFFLTPVIYPASLTGLMKWNPVAPLLEASRAHLLSQPAQVSGFTVALMAVAGLVLAWIFYRVAQPHVTARLG
jgi:lipopolysaccharide transport system permease protein